MTEIESVVVVTTKGRFHRAALLPNGTTLVSEACNLDDAPGTERIATPTELDNAEYDRLCLNKSCFGDPNP